MATGADVFARVGDIPATPWAFGIFDGKGNQQTVAGITAVWFSMWPAQGPGGALPLPGAAPVINRVAGTSITGGDGFTYVRYLPIAADLATAGSYVGLFELDQSANKTFVPDPIWIRVLISPSTS